MLPAKETGKRLNKRIIITLFIGLGCFITAVFIQSRSFVIGYTAGLVFLLLIYKKVALNQWRTTGVLAIVLLLAPLLACCFKKDSSLGRMLVYKLTWRMFKDHYATGVGWGNFEVSYGQYQVAYFRSGDYTTKELLLADNTRFAFNDYWQWVVETGVLGFVLLLLLAVLLAKLIKRAYNRVHHAPFLLLLATSQLIAISAAAFFTHVFERLFFQCLFAISFLTVLYYGLPAIKWRYVFWVMAVLTTGSIVRVHAFPYVTNYKSYRQYQHAKELFRAGFMQEGVQIYEQLYPVLYKDVTFSAAYALALINTGAYKEAIPVLERLIHINNSGTFTIQLGNCYFHTNQPHKAEDMYRTAVYMVPNRFSSRYYLFNFYVKTHQLEKARKAAKEILTLPVKVPSEQVTRVKAEVNTWMKAS